MARLDRLDEPCRWTASRFDCMNFQSDVLVHSVVENESHVNRACSRCSSTDRPETQRAPELVIRSTTP
jgi:hypothetical protein